ncbi:MAG: long-chain fatty acid--CoA ligase [Sphingobacteriales bacterium]|nr:MAG: long-chain fatty acid--CoA ligase [Sphingobacteriales bacterium]
MEINNLTTTIPKLLRNVVQNLHQASATFMLTKVNNQWQEISYQQTLNNADYIAAYLLSIGIKKGDCLALIVENSPEYVYFDQALQQIGCINTSIYPTLPEADIAYILNDSGCKAILVGNPFLLKKITFIANNCENLIRIIPVFDDFKIADNLGLNAGVVNLNSVLNEGKLKLNEYQSTINQIREAVSPFDISSLIYTSGTTGVPKGVMLTHSNFIENVKSSLKQIPIIDKEDTFLSFLPLSHIFERTATYHICCYAGCKIAFAQSLELLAKNMAEIKPTVIACVPRLLERIHDKAIKTATTSGLIKKEIFLWAIATGQAYRIVKENEKTPSTILSLKYNLANKLVFSKIREKTGGRLKFMISGGAALPKNVGEFFGNLNIKILEGYGLTETSPVVAVTELNRQIYGTVGRVIPDIEIAIQDTETKNMITLQTHHTFNKNFGCAEGEIIVRGHCVMKGYWNKPLETAEVIDSEGWFHTGDIGRFFKGNLQITDRIKNMLVNSFGKNIYPTPIENTYLKSAKIETVFLIGDKREYPTAIIVCPKETLQEQFGLPNSFFEDEESFIVNKQIYDWVGIDIKKLSTQIAKFERIKNFIIKKNPFTIEDGELTPSMKLKRKVIENKYATVIDGLYRNENLD